MFRLCRLVLVVVVVVLAGPAHGKDNQESSSRIHPNDQLLFAYMDTRNEEGTLRRTHVFALTQQGTLAKRVTTKIDEWRHRHSRRGGISRNGEDRVGMEKDDHRLRYQKTLEFASLENRQKKVDRLYELVTEFNQRANRLEIKPPLDRQESQDHYLIKMHEPFGAAVVQKALNPWLPSLTELNSLLEQSNLLRGLSSSDEGGANGTSITNKRLTSSLWGETRNDNDSTITNCWSIREDDDDDQGQLGEDDVATTQQQPVVSTSLTIDAATMTWAKIHCLQQQPNNDTAFYEQVLQLHSLLELIVTHIYAVQAMGQWQLENRFVFNSLKVNVEQPDVSEPFESEDIHPDRWKLALEMGGLYLAYNKLGGKNILHVMHDNDMDAFHRPTAIQFQQGFSSELYVVWSLGNETEQLKKDTFYNWWQRNDIMGNYGYSWGKWEQPNGFIRFGQQVCDPPTDCDMSWLDLLDEFAKTPVVEDIRFSWELPYGETRADLRFLYPGDDAILEEAQPRRLRRKLR